MQSKTIKNIVSRPPVVVVMGHIDHGKSTLLDYIRKSDIVSGEAGGITQHIGAYQAEYEASDGKKHMITFLDTPGHSAFCTIRERGAKSADVAILVVSAEDGVKPQTLEALNEIKKSEMPYVVAITKVDKPNADIDRTKTSLGENEIYVEGWGGDIPCVPVSAINGQGMNELLDMIVLISELADLKTDTSKSAEGVIIESELDPRSGISATLLIKDGTLHIGDFLVAEDAYTPVRYIENFKGEKIKIATASTPVRVIGWNKIPPCGSSFISIKNKKEAEKLVEQSIALRKDIQSKNNDMNISPKDSLGDKNTDGQTDDSGSLVDPDTSITIPIIIKADTIGSLDGVKHELAKITHEKVNLKIISEGIGEINENDVNIVLGKPETIIIGFNVMPDKKTSAMIERASFPINIGSFTVIYKLIEFLQENLDAKIPKEYVEETTGSAKILAIFSKEKDRQVVGGKVESGNLGNSNEVKILRRGAEIGRGKIRELQSKKIKTQEVATGFEFGMMIEAKNEIAVGDRIEACKMVEK